MRQTEWDYYAIGAELSAFLDAIELFYDDSVFVEFCEWHERWSRAIRKANSTSR